MSKFNFGTFLVDEANHDAFQICQDVAELLPISPLPALLVGDEGCGKSHLLYAIVNRVRAGTAKTGLALVTAQAFPDQVRHLIHDPAPVANAQSAILLVDQLERFRDHVDELEAVVRIFLDHGHYVVAASSVHPGRLRELPDGLRHLLEAGTIVTIRPEQSEPQVERIRRQIRSETELEMERQRQEIDELRAMLEQVSLSSPRSNEAPVPAAWEAELNEAQTEASQLRAALEASITARAAAEEALEAARAEIEGQEAKMAGVLAEAEAAHREALGNIREQLGVVEKRAHETGLRNEAIESELADLKEMFDAVSKDKSTFESELKRLREQLASMERPDDALLAELDQVRRRLTQIEDEHRAERSALDAAREEAVELVRRELAAVKAETEQREKDTEGERGRLEELLDGLRGEVDRLQTERTQIEEESTRQAREREQELQALQDRLAAGQDELEKLRQELNAQEELRTGEHDQLATEREALAQELGEIRAEHDQTLQRMAALENAAQTAQRNVETYRAELELTAGRLEALERAVQEARQERDDARAARDEAVRRAEHVLDQVEANRARMAEASEAQQTRIADLERRLSVVHASEEEGRAASAALEEALAQARREYDDMRTKAAQQIESLQVSLEEARAGRDAHVAQARDEAAEAIDRVDRMERERESMKSALDMERRRVRLLEGDLDALRTEAASQVARAHTQAGETESRLSRIMNAFETAATRNRVMQKQLGPLDSDTHHGAERLVEWARKLAAADPELLESAIDPDARGQAAEMHPRVRGIRSLPALSAFDNGDENDPSI